MEANPGNLQNLHDIVVPADVAWWPLAPGWYVVAGALTVALAYFVYRKLRQVRKNRYRVLALRELADLRQGSETAAMLQIPVLLKRAALSAWPREEVAALSGADWHRFLDRTAATNRFSSGAGQVLDSLAYGGAEAVTASDGKLEGAIEAAEFWLNHHRTETGAG